MRTRTLLGTLTACIATGAIALPALALDGAHAAASRNVTLKNIRFNPSRLTIKRGDTVTWLWRDGGTAHNVTGSGFKSRTMSSGSFKARFTRRGTFAYRCTIHVSLGMRGTIVVR